MTFNIVCYIIKKRCGEVRMLEKLENDLYILINQIEYYGEDYKDHKEELDRLEGQISLLKKIEKF